MVRTSGLHPETGAIVFYADRDTAVLFADGDGQPFFALFLPEAVFDGILDRNLDHHRRKFEQVGVDLRVDPDVGFERRAESFLFEGQIGTDEIYLFGKRDAQFFCQAQVEAHDFDQVA